MDGIMDICHLLNPGDVQVLAHSERVPVERPPLCMSDQSVITG